MVSTFHSLVLVAAGVIAGLVGSAGGITSLVSYPALLVVGLPALSANIANNVALVACWPGSAAASQSELRGQGSWLRRFTVVTAVGAAAGATLLLATPSDLFGRIVPFLVAAGSLSLLLESRLTAWRKRHGGGASPWAFPAGLLVLAVYNGYFGAGAGVMILTLVLVLVEPRLPTANALKNMLVGAASLVSVAIFGIAGSVRWGAAAPLALGMLVGSNLGPRVTRHVPERLLRGIIVILGMALAVQLWLHPGS